MVKRSKSNFSIGGFLLQLCGAIGAVYALGLLAVGLKGGGVPILFGALLLLVGISIGTLGTRLSVRYRCGACDGRVDKLSKACPRCGQELEALA